jgi:hypothetical protein
MLREIAKIKKREHLEEKILPRKIQVKAKNGSTVYGLFKLFKNN